jgi:hypothetical protein
MDYTEIKCPKCESENFDEIDYGNSCDIDNNKNVTFECQDCSCQWIQVKRDCYSENVNIISNDEEDTEEK